MERAEYRRHSRARMAETAKDASRHATAELLSLALFTTRTSAMKLPLQFVRPLSR